MRKLLVTLAMAGALSVPSTVFAEASWYGSLRGGVNVGGGNDASFYDGGSRWGIRGSSEASEGLTVTYRFEHKISTTDGGQPGGRLANVGLSGGFGSLTLGQIWNAAYNHPGSITDKSNYFGDAGTGYRHGNALSYAYSNDAIGFQLDLVADSSMNTGDAFDKMEFGMTVGLGEIGRVALAHTSQRDENIMTVVPAMFTPGSYTPGSYTPGSFMPGSYAQGMFVANTPYAPGADGSIQILTTADDPATTDDETMYTAVQQLMVRVAMGASATESNVLTVGEGEDAVHYLLAGAANALLNAIDYDTTNEIWESGACDDTNADEFDDCVDAIVYYSDAPIAIGYANNAGDATNTATPGTSYARTFHAAPLNEDEDAIDMDKLVVTDAVDPTTGTAASYTDGTYTPGTFTPGTFTEGSYTPGVFTPASMAPAVSAGYKRTHIAIELALGGITPYLGYSKSKVNGAANDSTTTHYGFSGSLGDTGMNYLVAGRSVKAAGGGKSSPWLIGMTKDLGGGATLVFEHGNSDDGSSGNSRLGMHVNF